MSSDDDLCLNRQSMSRMNDSLVAVILSHLSLKEKLMFECLSKQFQRLIYKNVTDVRLTRGEPPNTSLEGMMCDIKVVDFTSAMANKCHMIGINKQYLTSFLQKCQNIEKVFLNCYLDFDDLMTIGRLCPKMKVLYLQTFSLSAHDLEQFGQLYGHRLKKVHFYSIHLGRNPWIQNNWTQLLKHCPNLAQVVAPTDIFNHITSDDNQYLPKLESVTGFPAYQLGSSRSSFNSEEECEKHLDIFTRFCRKYSQTMKDLFLYSYIGMNKQQIDQFFTGLSNFKNLQSFTLYLFKGGPLDDYFVDNLSDVSKSLTKLKKLDVTIDVLGLNCDHFLEAFKGFKNLTELKINIQSAIFTANVQIFKDLRSLRRFTISCHCINEDFFVEIGKYLPNLRQLKISRETEISDKTVVEFSKLKNLQNLYLFRFKSNNKSITDSGVCALINGCLLIRDIAFTSRPLITSKTIETLISSANRWPNKTIKLSAGFANTMDANEFPLINLDVYHQRIPPNLNINLAYYHINL